MGGPVVPEVKIIHESLFKYLLFKEYFSLLRFFKFLLILKTFLLINLEKFLSLFVLEKIIFGLVNFKIYSRPTPFLFSPNGIQIIPEVIHAKNNKISS